MQVKFDKTCPAWEKDPKERLMFIKYTLHHFQQVLKFRGYVTVMEVLGSLSIPVNIDLFLSKPVSDVVWVRDRGDEVIIRIWEEQDDGSLILDINID